jgi:hypothetical protein
MSGDGTDASFLARWSRRKAQAQQGVAPAEAAAGADSAVAAPTAAEAPAPMPAPAQPITDSAQSPRTEPTAPAAERPPPPTLADVAALTRESDYSRFVAPEVSGEVKNAALKKLFGNPHFNVMDGLDVYIDDYSKPDPLPASMVRQMAQAAFLGLVDVEPPKSHAAVGSAAATRAPVQGPPVELASADEHRDVNPESDEDADLRLQSHDAAGCGGAEDSAAADGPGQL